jgi:hypothetical protein
MDVGAVPACFEQRETYCVFAGQEGAADKAIAVADDPITPAVALDVEVIGRGRQMEGQKQALALRHLFRDPE